MITHHCSKRNQIFSRTRPLARAMSNSIKSVSVLGQITYPSGLFSRLSWGVAIIALSGLALLLLPRVALGDGGTIPATVEIKIQLSLTKTADLNFGQVRSGHSDGTVVVTPLNERFPTGDVTLRALTNFSRAEFIITGDPGDSYNIEPVLDFALHDQRGDPVLDVTLLEVVDLISFSSNVGQGLVGQIGTDGIDSIFVGGTLLVPPGAKFGKYGGQVTLTINF